MMIPSIVGKTLFFDEEKHRYTDINGNALISASQLVEKFVCPFDPNGEILLKCAQKKGISPEELRAEWEKINRESCEYGTAVHKSLEDFINTGQINKDDPNADIVREFAKINFTGKLQSEIKVASFTHKIAGTIDLIEFLDDTTINLLDFKSNKKLEKFSIFKNRMLFPFNRLYSTNFLHYTFQLGIYAIILEEMGFWINDMCLLYINPKTRKIEKHPVEYRRNDVKRMIEYYHDPAKFKKKYLFHF